MRYFLTLLILTVIAGCSSDEAVKKDANVVMKNNYPNLVQVEEPQNVETEPSKVYVDSIRVINYKNEKALLISGNFANSCTSLKEVSHSASGDTLSITLSGWMPADKLCATVLTPFSFIFNSLTNEGVNQFSVVEVNGNTYNL